MYVCMQYVVYAYQAVVNTSSIDYYAFLPSFTFNNEIIVVLLE